MSGLVRWMAIAAAAFPLSLPVQAESVIAVTPLKWHCVQTMDAQFNVACRPMPANTPVELAEHASLAGATDKPTAAMGLLPVAQRGTAEVFSTPAWLIPLHVAPVDVAHVHLLLESVLCGAQSQCKVTYGEANNGAVSVTLAGR